MYIDIIVKKKNPQFFVVKNINIYSIFYLISFNFKEPQPDRSRTLLAAPAPGFFVGAAPASGFFLKRLGSGSKGSKTTGSGSPALVYIYLYYYICSCLSLFLILSFILRLHLLFFSCPFLIFSLYPPIFQFFCRNFSLLLGSENGQNIIYLLYT